MRCPSPRCGRSGAHRVFTEELVADQHHSGGAVGHLTAVIPADSALDQWVDHVVAAVGCQVGYLPGPRLGVRVALGVGQVDRRDGVEMGVVDAEPAVIFIGYRSEHGRPQKPGSLALMAGPGCRSQVLGGGVPGTVFSTPGRPPVLCGSFLPAGRRSLPGQPHCRTRRRPHAGSRECPRVLRGRWPASP